MVYEFDEKMSNELEIHFFQHFDMNKNKSKHSKSEHFKQFYFTCLNNILKSAHF